MSTPTWQEALAQNKLRLRYDVELPPTVGVDRVMPSLYAAARALRAYPDVSQDETYHFHEVERLGNGVRLRLSVVYDYDFHAMYDQCESDQVVLFCATADETVQIEEWSGRRSS